MDSKDIIMENLGADPNENQTEAPEGHKCKCRTFLICCFVTVILLMVAIIAFSLTKKPKTEVENHEYKYSYEIVGPGGGGAMYLPRINPHDANNLIVSTDMGSFYASRDRGKTWKRNRVVGHIRSITFDPSLPNVVYIASEPCVYISEDYGFTAHLFFPKESDIIDELTVNEYTKRMLIINKTTTNYTGVDDTVSVEVNPNDRNNLLVLLNNGKLFETKDHGETFVKVHDFGNQGFSMDYEIMFYNEDKSWIIFYKDIYKYKNNEVQKIYSGDIRSVSITNDGKWCLFIQNNAHENFTNSLYYTKDFIDIKNFDNVLSNIPGSYSDKWWTTSFTHEIKHAAGNTINDIYVGTDQASGGISSNVVHVINMKEVKFVYSFPFLIPSFGIKEHGWHEKAEWFNWNFGLTCRNNEVMFTTSATTYICDEKGCENLAYNIINDTELVNADGVKKNTFLTTTRGLDDVTTYFTRIDPFDKTHHIQCVTDYCLVRSYDSGKTWFRYGDYNTCYDLHFDEKKKGYVYAIFSDRHDAPYEPFGDYDTQFNGAFGISHDGGRTFDYKYAQGLPPKIIPYKLEVVYDNDNRIFYIATFNYGFFVSYDNGKTFKEMNEGIPRYNNNLIYAEDIVVKGGHIFGVTACARKLKFDSYLMEYINNKWEMIDLPENTTNLRDIAYNTQENALYISCIPKQIWTDIPINYGGGLLAYKDSKITRIFDEKEAVFGVNIDKHGDLYVTLHKGDIYRKKLNSDNFEIIIDKLFYRSKGISFGDDNHFYVSSLGGGMQLVTRTEKK